MKSELIRYARYLDAGLILDNETEPSYSSYNSVTESSLKVQPMPSFMDAIFLAREIVQQKKCARISLARFISRFYLTLENA